MSLSAAILGVVPPGSSPEAASTAPLYCTGCGCPCAEPRSALGEDVAQWWCFDCTNLWLATGVLPGGDGP